MKRNEWTLQFHNLIIINFMPLTKFGLHKNQILHVWTYTRLNY
jgi:hypothetical protein